MINHKLTYAINEALQYIPTNSCSIYLGNNFSISFSTFARNDNLIYPHSTSILRNIEIYKVQDFANY